MGMNLLFSQGFSCLACLEECCKCIYAVYDTSNHEFSGYRKQVKHAFCGLAHWFRLFGTSV